MNLDLCSPSESTYMPISWKKLLFLPFKAAAKSFTVFNLVYLGCSLGIWIKIVSFSVIFKINVERITENASESQITWHFVCIETFSAATFWQHRGQTKQCCCLKDVHKAVCFCQNKTPFDTGHPPCLHTALSLAVRLKICKLILFFSDPFKSAEQGNA